MACHQKDIEEAVAAKLNVSSLFAKAAVIATLDAIRAAILRDERVTIAGLGSFETSYVPRHMTTCHGKPFPVPAFRRLYFRASGSLKEKLVIPDGKDNAQPNQ
jgi:nucleoid DNA-binding protein